MVIINIWIAIILLRILHFTQAITLNEQSQIPDAIINDIKMLTTVKAKHYTYKTNIIYFTNKTRILLDYLDDMNSKRILIKLNASTSPAVQPEHNCTQLELILDDENTTKTFVCINGMQLSYNRFKFPLPGPSKYTTDCRKIMLIEHFNDVHHLTNMIMKHPNLIKIVYAMNDCDLIEYELYKYYKFLWDANRILYVQYISHCGLTTGSTLIYNFSPFARNQFESFDVYGAITRKRFTTDFVVDLAIRNFNGYKLNVLFFPTTMAFLKSKLNLVQFKRIARHKDWHDEIRDLNSMYGLDVNVLNVWMEMNNFTVNTIPTTDGEFYGYRGDKGKFNGGLGDIVYKRVEFIANGYFIKDYESRLIEFSHAVISERLCLMVKTADLVPSSLILVRCFSPKVWISIVVTLVVVGFTYAILKEKGQDLLLNEVAHRRELRFHNTLKTTFSIITTRIELMFQIMGLLLSAPNLNISHMQHERIFLTACFLWSLNISGAFQGSLVDVYTTPTSYPNIDTLEQLDKADYPIAARHPGLIVDVFGNKSHGDTIGNLRTKLYPTENDFLASKIAKHGKLAALERLADYQIISSGNMRNDGESYIHLVKECPRGYLLSYLFPKSSVFLEKINFDVDLLLQSGLISKWEKDTFYWQKLAGALEHRKFLKSSMIKLTLNHLQVAFFILGLGLFAGTFIFFVEICFIERVKLSKQL